MKWNWGTKIFIAIILFMSLIIVLVIFSMRQTYYLVEKDYYPKGLEYQQKIDKEMNAKKIGEMIHIENRGIALEIGFPTDFAPQSIKGEIIFYRPSDETKDVSVPIQLDSTLQMIYNTSGLANGRYIIKFDYSVNDTGYYQESTIFIEK
jgi:hypothetical protein